MFSTIFFRVTDEKEQKITARRFGLYIFFPSFLPRKMGKRRVAVSPDTWIEFLFFLLVVFFSLFLFLLLLFQFFSNIYIFLSLSLSLSFFLCVSFPLCDGHSLPRVFFYFHFISFRSSTPPALAPPIHPPTIRFRTRKRLLCVVKGPIETQ